ncbi:MAG: polymer-forming cytoskeletal protein [Rhodospirillaceae bacterium]|jgi:cytoskeletal protein CcmA (bactofilin family)|nr:polymer-forming cytoskeletal protein [Rhodospirillaceae bacterium]
MFSRARGKDSEGGGTAAVQKSSVPSIISADLRITGNLESDGDIQIDGTVDGDIRSGRITVSETAVVKGALEAETVRIAGKVTGQIKARQVTLLKSAKVVADVMQESIAVEPGASFEGNCRHYTRDAVVTPTPRKVEALVAPTMPRKPPVEAVKPPPVAAVGGGSPQAN